MSNDTKIKFLKVTDKLYEVTKISFFHMTIDAMETDIDTGDVPEHEIFDIMDFKNFKIKLMNKAGA